MSLSGGEGNTLLLRDELTDAVYEVRPHLVINAAGPWIDFANRSLGLSTHFIGGTKVRILFSIILSFARQLAITNFSSRIRTEGSF